MSDHHRGRRRAMAAFACVLGGSLWLPAVPAQSAPPPLPTGCTQPAVGGTVTCVYSYTGAGHLFTVPTGVESVRLTAAGGRGASSQGSGSAPGGRSGFARADFAVTPGEILVVWVAQDGTNISGGFGGQGWAAGGSSDYLSGGAGGGGASAIERAGSPLIVAGGGGGGGVGSTCVSGGAGGDAGLVGSGGTACGATAGGAGGPAGTQAGASGGNAIRNDSRPGGGGGGAGYRGGDGGTGRGYNPNTGEFSGAGGGGGGTNYTGSGTNAQSGWTGRSWGENGVVVITWEPTGPVTDITLSPESSTILVGERQDYTVIGYEASGASTGDITANAALGISPSGVCGVGYCNPTAGGVQTVTARHSGSGAQATAELIANQAPFFTSPAATTFAVGERGAFAVTATGYPAPELSLAGDLPAGVTFDATSGRLSGTPQVGSGGVYALQLTASNGIGSPATQTLTLTVEEGPAFTSADSTTFTVGSVGVFAVTASGNPRPDILMTSGVLPAGVSFDVDARELRGTPEPGAGGVYPLTFGAGNGVGDPAIQQFTLTVNEAPYFTSPDATTFTVGSAGGVSVTASGYPAPSLSMAGSLPPGVTFDDATGRLSGTPEPGSGGVYTPTFFAGNGVGDNARQDFVLTVEEAAEITSVDATTFTVGEAGSFTVTTRGYPAPTGITLAGEVPDGVVFNTATGLLDGTPAVGTGGVYALEFSVTNGIGGPATQAFTLTVEETPAITSVDEVVLDLDEPGEFEVTTLGHPAPEITKRGAHPEGMSFTDNGDGTATLAGTPTEDGDFEIELSASNDLGTAEQTLSVMVASLPTFTSSGSPTFREGRRGAFLIRTKGHPPALLSKDGDLPKGLKFTDHGDGTATIAGTPKDGSAGDYKVTVTASNDGGASARDRDSVAALETGQVRQRMTITVKTESGDDPSASPSPSPKPEDKLPNTGGPSMVLATVGLVLVLGGGTVLVASRRPRRRTH